MVTVCNLIVGSLEEAEATISEALALRRPQLRQVEAELAAAENQLKRAQLDLARTRVTLPFDVIVLSRSRVGGEVVAARELVGRVTRADQYWVELRTRPDRLGRIRARQDDRPGSRVVVRDAAATHEGEVVRITSSGVTEYGDFGHSVALAEGVLDERDDSDE